MTHLAFYNPHSDIPICLERLYEHELEHAQHHISTLGRITRYNYYKYGPKTIVVKSCNLVFLDVPRYLNDYIPLRTVLSDLWSTGLLHTFSFESYPELLL